MSTSILFLAEGASHVTSFIRMHSIHCINFTMTDITWTRMHLVKGSRFNIFHKLGQIYTSGVFGHGEWKLNLMVSYAAWNFMKCIWVGCVWKRPAWNETSFATVPRYYKRAWTKVILPQVLQKEVLINVVLPEIKSESLEAVLTILVESPSPYIKCQNNY